MRTDKRLALAAGVFVVLVLMVFVVFDADWGRGRTRGEAGATGIDAGRTGEAGPKSMRVPDASMPSGIRRLTPKERKAILALMTLARENRGAESDETPPASSEAPARNIGMSEIGGAMREVHPLLRECYELGRLRDPTIEGIIKVKFRLLGEPEIGVLVEDIVIKEGSTLEDAEVRECIVATLGTLQFPAPNQPIDIKVAGYPLFFRPTPPPAP